MGSFPRLLVADLLIEDVGVDLQRLPGGGSTRPAELEDAESVSLKLLDSGGDVAPLAAALLLRAPEDGAAEAGGVPRGRGGTAALQHLVPVRAVASAT